MFLIFSEGNVFHITLQQQMAQIAEKLLRESASECNNKLSEQNSESNRPTCAQIYRDCCVMLRMALIIF